MKIVLKNPELQASLDRMAKVEHQCVDGLNWLLSARDSQWRSKLGCEVSQAEYEVVETLPEMPEDAPSSEDKDMKRLKLS